jgi:hypothetical protein
MKNNAQKNAADEFTEWFDTYGVRNFSRNHGTADGHREYMALAFMTGYQIAERKYNELTNTNKD